MVLPQAQYDWLNLRFQDFKSVGEYNSALHRIVSQLKLCGQQITDKEMLEKTLSTFHANNLILQQQYRTKNYTKHSELISVLLVAEKHNQLLMQNHSSRSTGSAPMPEANSAQQRNNNKFGNGRGRRNNRGGRWNNRRGRGHDNGPRPHQFKKDKGPVEQVSKARNFDTICYRCGVKGHWSRTCLTPKHLVNLYQKEQATKKKKAHFVDETTSDVLDKSNDTTMLDIDDFGV